VLEPYPPHWEIELEDILASLPNRRSLPTSKATDKLAYVYLEYEALVKVVEKQREDYRQLRRLLLETREEMEAMLQRLIKAEGLEAPFAE
jgi:hypothetical protein